MIYNTALKSLLFIALVSIGLSCERSENPEPDENTTLADHRIKLAINISDHYILPGYQALLNEVTKLDSLVQLFSENPNTQDLLPLRQQLRESWMQWQKVEMFQFGPAETFAIRAAINTYPANAQKINLNINSGLFSLGTIAQLDAGGFPTLDLLLHDPVAGDDQLIDLFLQDPKRVSYLQSVSNHIRESADAVHAQWTASGYLEDFKSAENSGTDVGSSLGILINALDLHFQRYLRDGKIAIPAGIRSAGVVRPTATEAYYAGYSVDLLQTALEAYQDLFEGQGIDGNSGFSLLDYLEALKRPELVNQIQTAFELAIAQAGQLNDPLSLQITDDPEPVITLFLRLQDIVTLIKADAVSAMGITLTNQDTDGD